MTDWLPKPTHDGKWFVKHESDNGEEGLVYDANIRLDNLGGWEAMIHTDDPTFRWHALEWVLLNGWTQWSPVSKFSRT